MKVRADACKRIMSGSTNEMTALNVDKPERKASEKDDGCTMPVDSIIQAIELGYFESEGIDRSRTHTTRDL
jgi:hypothetical protein